MPRKHRHRHVLGSFTGVTGGGVSIFRCKCGDVVLRPSTALEEEARGLLELRTGCHAVYHAFLRRFKGKDGQWKTTRYPLMQAIRRWAVRYPEDVRVLSVDDDVHASSLFVLIEHRSATLGAESYMGTTCVYIPQCSEGEPAVFFLYPESRGALIRALVNIRRMAGPLVAAERKIEVRAAALLKGAKP